MEFSKEFMENELEDLNELIKRSLQLNNNELSSRTELVVYGTLTTIQCNNKLCDTCNTNTLLKDGCKGFMKTMNNKLSECEKDEVILIVGGVLEDKFKGII